MTPAIFEYGLRKNIVSLNDVTMMIFDECHHTQAGNQYNKIMGVYVDQKLNRDKTNDASASAALAALPQVNGIQGIISSSNEVATWRCRFHNVCVCICQLSTGQSFLVILTILHPKVTHGTRKNPIILWPSRSRSKGQRVQNPYFPLYSMKNYLESCALDSNNSF